MPPRRSSELGSHPGDRRTDLAQIVVLALGPQVPVPAGAHVDSLDHRTHEREVA